AAADRETNTLALTDAYLQGKVNLALLGDSTVTLGRQRVKFGHGFLLDTHFAGVDGVRVDTNRFGLNWTFAAADIPTGTFFTDYLDKTEKDKTEKDKTDGMFGVRVNRHFLKDRLHLGVSWLYTGAGNYKAYGADATLKLLGGNILPELRFEWVRSYRDQTNERARGNLFYVDADIFKSPRFNIAASYVDASKSFAPHIVTVYNPFFITKTEQLFLRPVAYDALVSGEKGKDFFLADKVFDIRADLKIFAENPISLRWFRGDTQTGTKFGDVFTIAYRGWKIGNVAIDAVYGNKRKGGTGIKQQKGDTPTPIKQQYVGLAASATF
ncbi:MAG: hypothetical protein C4295_10105, partial [Candidatus Fervidibacterota bacterium]